MAKITPVLMQHKQNGNGRSPIYLRLSSGGKTKYKSLGYRIKETHWNERSRRVRKSHKKHAEINALIRSKLSVRYLRSGEAVGRASKRASGGSGGPISGAA